MTMMISPSDKARGLYIHIPFCKRKCRYCDFVSYTGCMDLAEEYISALICEADEYRGAEVDTIFVGGGTPTLLASKMLERLCGAVSDIFDVKPGYEFTVEANPGTIDYDKAAALAECGVNRISIGVQSFNDDELKLLGRIHDAQTAVQSVCAVHEAGIPNISIDLMTALPDQTMKQLMNSLKTAVQLPVNHISAYSLIIEAGTPLAEDYARGLITVPDEDTDREMYAGTVGFLRDHGFDQYEISNFALPGCESRHNIKYWECNEYFGIGAAAHSYVEGVRYSNTTLLDEYIAGNYRSPERIVLSRDDMVSEFIMMGMRMNRGISAAEYERRFSESVYDRYGKLLKRFAEGDFIEMSGEYIRFTDRGRDVSNAVLCEFMR